VRTVQQRLRKRAGEGVRTVRRGRRGRTGTVRGAREGGARPQVQKVQSRDVGLALGAVEGRGLLQEEGRSNCKGV